MRSLFFNFHFSLFTYLSRLPRSRGFGVQSPTDYHFLRHVIRQRNPYYAYEDLAAETEHLSKREVEIQHFYLRLANYVQDSGEIIVLCERPTIDTQHFQQWERAMELRKKFLKAGSRKVKALVTTELPREIPDGSLLAIENFHKKTPFAQHPALSILLDKRATVIFDMYDLAVAFINPKRSKTTYKVNL